MVKHMIIWKIKEDAPNKQEIKSDIKASLEGLVGKIEGLHKTEILTEGFDSSSGDLMMDSVFENNDALRAYQQNPLHKEIAVNKVRPNMCQRLSFDYEI